MLATYIVYNKILSEDGHNCLRTKYTAQRFRKIDQIVNGGCVTQLQVPQMHAYEYNWITYPHHNSLLKIFKVSYSFCE